MSKLKEKTKLINIRNRIADLIKTHCHGDYRSRHVDSAYRTHGCSPEGCNLAGDRVYKSYHCRLVVAQDAVDDILSSGAFDGI